MDTDALVHPVTLIHTEPPSVSSGAESLEDLFDSLPGLSGIQQSWVVELDSPGLYLWLLPGLSEPYL